MRNEGLYNIGKPFLNYEAPLWWLEGFYAEA
jgi:hypothetical protein